jgi:hypothetical protein
MKSQDIQNLQEAYDQVYELDEAVKGESSDRRKDLAAQRRAGHKPLPPSRGRENVAKMKRDIEYFDREKIKNEEFDLYNVILSHLLDEGYASTEESADKIILSMSESWFEDIMEARRSEKEGKGSPEHALSYPGRKTQKERGEMGGRHWQSGGEGGSKTERGRKKSDKYSQAQRLRGLSIYPEKPGKYAEMQRKRRGGDIGSRFD